MNLKENIDFKNGNITYYDFNINPNLSFKDQISDMQDGLIQIEYNNYIVDVGWRPECNVNGSFIILVIKDQNWAEPIYTKNTRNFWRLKQYLQECINLAASLTNNDQNLADFIQKNSGDTKYANFSFDRSEFKEFFDEESACDIESGSFYYSIKLERGFELEVNILAIDEFISVTLQNESLQFPILNIGFDEIVKIKLNKRDDLDYVGLDLYKNTLGLSSDDKDSKPFLSITIKPSISITLGA